MKKQDVSAFAKKISLPVKSSIQIKGSNAMFQVSPLQQFKKIKYV